MQRKYIGYSTNKQQKWCKPIEILMKNFLCLNGKCEHRWNMWKFKKFLRKKMFWRSLDTFVHNSIFYCEYEKEMGQKSSVGNRWRTVNLERTCVCLLLLALLCFMLFASAQCRLFTSQPIHHSMVNLWRCVVPVLRRILYHSVFVCACLRLCVYVW